MSSRLPVLIVGAGGHGQDVRAVLDAYTAAGGGWEFAGFLDDDASRDDDVIGDVKTLGLEGPELFLVGINDGAVRRRIVGLAHPARHSPGLVHPKAIIGPNCHVRPGAVVAAGAILSCNVVVGRHAHVNVGATVSQGSTLADYVTVSPGAHVCGDCIICEGASLGAGAIVPNLYVVKRWKKIGAGRVVTG